MSRLLAAACLALALALALSAQHADGSSLQQEQKEIEALRSKSWSQEEVDRVCDQLEKGGGPIKCQHRDPSRMGKSALEKGIVGANREPVILVPGLGGSGIDAKLDKQDQASWYCWKKADWYRLWMSLPSVLTQDCWFDNLQIVYNVSSDDYANRPGVETRATDFGGLKGVDYLDYLFGFPVPLTGYYNSMIASLQAVGYVGGQDLFGAPYDWRVPSSDHELTDQDFYAKFDSLIAEARAKNGGKRVHVVTHSMGGPTALRFFNLKSQVWLDENIASFIPIAGPWSGSAKALRAVLSGDDFGLAAFGKSLVDLNKVKQIARQMGGIVYLIPDPLFYPPAEIFVRANISGRIVSFTASDFNSLFAAAGTPITATIHTRTMDIMDNLAKPRVSTHCIYGTGLETEVGYNYTAGLDSQPTIVYDQDGDGTVPIESLKKCTGWIGAQPQPVVHKEFDLRGHSGILEDSDVFDYIISVVTSSSPVL